VFYVSLKNFSLIWRRLHCREGLLSLGLCSALRAFEQGGVFIVPQFSQSHPKDHPIQSPLTTLSGMQRIYSNPDPHGNIDWLFSVLRPAQEYFDLYGDVTIIAEGLQNLGLCLQGLWAGRDLDGATPAVTRDLGFSGLIRRTAPFSRLLRHTRPWGCGESLLTRILTRPDGNMQV
jgi:hypothetical protein